MNRLFETIYAHDRRKHSHRCRCCSRIIKTGERVLMMLVQRGTWALHAECADKPHPVGTWRQAFEIWSSDRKAAA